MVKHHRSKKKFTETLNSYILKSTNETIQPGDCVEMQPPNPSSPSYVARVVSIQSNHRKAVKVHVQWYYHPEDTKFGRTSFHGLKELLSSKHFDIQSVDTIQRKCIVHTFDSYMDLDPVQQNDYFSRFHYSWETGHITCQKLVLAECKCRLPYNPDALMVKCDDCGHRSHPECIDMTTEEANRMRNFFCRYCLAKKNRIPENRMLFE